MNPALVNLAHWENTVDCTDNVCYDLARIIGAIDYERLKIKPPRLGIFGSAAQGSFHQKSDLDIVVICDSLWTYTVLGENSRQLDAVLSYLAGEEEYGHSTEVNLMNYEVANGFRNDSLISSGLAGAASPLRELLNKPITQNMVYSKSPDLISNKRAKKARRNLMANILGTYFPDWMDVVILPENWRRSLGWIDSVYGFTDDKKFAEILDGQIMEFDLPPMSIGIPNLKPMIKEPTPF